MIKGSDVKISLILGLLIAAFLLITLKIVGQEIGLAWQKEWNWALFLGLPLLAFLGITAASYIGRKFFTLYQMAKFYLVGISSAAIDFGILNLLMWFSGIATGPFYVLFKVFSVLLSTINGYLWNKHWTFLKNDSLFSVKEFAKFILVTSMGIFIDILVAGFLVVIIGPRFGMSDILWANFGAFVAAVIASFWNFAGLKMFVFKK